MACQQALQGWEKGEVTAQRRNPSLAIASLLGKLARLHHHPYILMRGGVASAREERSPHEAEALNPKP